MTYSKIVVLQKECPKCKYKWITRTKKPKRCAKCGKWLDKGELK